MTTKELMYVEDALGHECFMKTTSPQAASQLTDPTLSSYMNELSKTHTALFNKFLNLL